MFKLVVLAAFVGSTVALRPRLDGRIVGGDEAHIEDHPHQVSLQYYRIHICGGAIIAAKWVVTAAHCTHASDPGEMSVLAGVSNLNDEGQQIRVLRLFQHPGFSTSMIDFDVAVIELAGPVAFGKGARPIALPAEGSDPVAGTDAVCTGWGATQEGGWSSEDLRAVTIQIVDRETCRRQYGADSITERMICAGAPVGGKDACQGDSGGPLVADGQLVGVVSWGYGCARPGHAGVYANVGNLRGYIRELSGL